MLLMLTAAPVLWEGDSGLKFRDLVVEFSRWVLEPKFFSTVDYRHLPTGGGDVNLPNHYGCIIPMWRQRADAPLSSGLSIDGAPFCAGTGS